MARRGSRSVGLWVSAVIVLLAFGGIAAIGNPVRAEAPSGVAPPAASGTHTESSSPSAHAMPSIPTIASGAVLGGAGPSGRLASLSGSAAPEAQSRPGVVPPSITLTPNNGTVGTAVAVNGTAFAPSNPNATVAVTIWWAPGDWVLCNVAVDESGNFSCGFLVPIAIEGAHAVNATEPGGSSASATFSVVPWISISPSTATPGSAVVVNASGFGKNLTATTTVGAIVASVCSFNLSSTGWGVCGWTLPNSELPGSYVIHVKDSAANTASTNLTIVPTPPTVSVAYTSTIDLYMPTPLNLSWTITSSAAVNTETTLMWILVSDLGSSACPSLASPNAPCPVFNESLNDLLVNGTDSYAYQLTAANMSSQSYNGGVLPFSTEYAVSIYVSIATSPYVNGTTAGSVGGSATTANIYLSTYLPAATLVSPSPAAWVSTGNVSVVVSYSGDFVSGATVNIYGAKSVLVYTAGVAVGGSGPHVGSAAAPWRPNVPGAYVAEVNLSGPFGYQLFDFDLKVVPAGSSIYFNSSSYHNASILPGLTPAVSGTLLLVLGVILGMIVAFVVARTMMSSGRASPAPWSGSSASGPKKDAGENLSECPVCHQWFPGPKELAEHSAKVHGTGT